MKKIDGFDDCVVGIVERCTQPPILCYDRDKIVSKLIREQQMTWDEAFEYFDTNIKGAWVGNDTPCFLWEDERAFENIEDFGEVDEEDEQ
jgi:hypothetical protein